MVTQASLLSDLESVAGPKHVSSRDAADFAVDGAAPHAVVRPGTYAEAAQVVRYANEAGLAVIPWGGGTQMGIGNVPDRYDLALSLSRLDGVIEHEPADLTVTCQAGITLSRLREQFASSGQLVPIDPALPGKATAGGVLAANASGPSRLAYGTARDFTIGMRVVTADGRITRAGGKVVKNVAGYDLCKLYIGSLGTLGVIVEATFKVLPLPKAERSLALAFDSADAACVLARELHRRGLALRATQMVRRASSYVLQIDLAGAASAVERSLHEIETVAAEHGGKPAEPLPLAKPSGGLVCRFGTLSTLVPALVGGLDALGATCIAYPTAGVVRASSPEASEPVVERLRAAARAADATMVIETAPPALKQAIDVFGEPPPSVALMRAVKQQFDPKGTLSPGRFVGRL